MSDLRSYDFELVYQCIESIDRETKYWSRINLKNLTLTQFVVQVKKEIAEGMFQLASAAILRMDNRSTQHDLMWAYRALHAEIEAHEQRRIVQEIGRQ